MNAMGRPLFLSLPVALLAACASRNPGVETLGGDRFVIEVAHVSGVAAAESGLAQAQSLCGAHGRLFLMTDSQVGSSAYRMEFRCVAPGNLPPTAEVAAAAPPPPASGRRAAPPTEARRATPPLRVAASLPAMEKDTRPAAAWQPADGNVLPVNPPMTPRPLFAPPAGQSFVAAEPEPRRMPPPDDSALVALPRLESGAIPSAPRPPAADAAPLKPAAEARAPALPMITASQPLPVHGLVVPSPNPLPGAPSSLPPIAGPAPMPSFPTGGPSGFGTGMTSFTQGFR